MFRNCLPFTTFAVLAITLSPQVATAGPISWSYLTSVTYAQDYGNRFAVNLLPTWPMNTQAGDTSWVPLFTSTGNPRPVPGEYTASYDFTIGVTLTDQASGQFADLSFSGGYASQWSYQDANDPDSWRWDSESFMFGDFWQRQTLTLGDNLYSVRAYGYGTGSFPSGELEVSVTPLAIPEPGTLVLAGIGLTGFSAFRHRWRANGIT